MKWNWLELRRHLALAAHPERPVAFTLYVSLLLAWMWLLRNISPLLAVIAWAFCSFWLFTRLRKLHDCLNKKPFL